LFFDFLPDIADADFARAASLVVPLEVLLRHVDPAH
jgi:hypothetical protein